MIQRTPHALPLLGATLLAAGLSLSAAGSTFAQPASRAGARTLTLEQAIALAGEQNPALLAARERRNGAEGAVWGAAGRMLPSVQFSGLWNFLEKIQVIPNPFAPGTLKLDFTQDYQGGMNVGLPVFTWGALRAGWQDARIALAATSSEIEMTEDDIALQVTRAFYGVLLAERGLQVARDALAQAERQEGIAAERLAQGAVSEFDHLRAKVQVANLRPGVARAEAAVRGAHIGLNLVLGLHPDEEVRLTGDLEYRPVELDLVALKQEALEVRPEIRTARLTEQRADLAVSMAKASRLPSLSITGQYGFRADNVGLTQRFSDSYTANLVVAIPLFDGFSAKSRTAQAKAGRQQAMIILEQTRRGIEAEVEQAYRDLQAAEQSYLAQLDNVAQAERALEIAQVSFENEMMTSVELMDSQLALTMARQNHYQSLYDYRIALARIERATGRPVSF
jgi:outer membrane protein